ncbi:hypothetical protein GCM10027610_035340 [Dactylosporangium cerinum]
MFNGVWNVSPSTFSRTVGGRPRRQRDSPTAGLRTRRYLLAGIPAVPRVLVSGCEEQSGDTHRVVPHPETGRPGTWPRGERDGNPASRHLDDVWGSVCSVEYAENRGARLARRYIAAVRDSSPTARAA